MRTMAFILALCLSFMSTSALAGVPGLISFQGTLIDSGGVTLDTTLAMTFTIYPDSTGGTQIWSETQSTVQVAHGMFNVLLGQENAIGDTVFYGSSRWLGLQVEGDPELVPRQRISSVGYAFRASQADTAEYARSVTGSSDGDWTISGNHMYSAVPGSVGIGTVNPQAKLDVQGSLNVGMDDTGYDVNFYGSGSGSRFYWDQDKMALRAGQDFDGTHWHPDSTGWYSVALGYNTKALQAYCTSIGSWTSARGVFSTALGYYTTATRHAATAMGDGSTASGEISTAIGNAATASGDWSTAIGSNTIASGDEALALGRRTTASGYNATAMGYKTTARGDYSVAVGEYLRADSANTIVLGKGISDVDRLVNDVNNSLVVGFDDTTAALFVGGGHNRVGVGTTSPATKLDIRGTVKVGEEDGTGYDVIFYGGAYTGGQFFWHQNKMALRAGRDVDGTHWAPDSIGLCSFATGINTKASGIDAVAMGEGSIASALNATALGKSTTADYEAAFAAGAYTAASGYASTAIGGYSSASGHHASVMGSYLGATADYSMALGHGLNNSNRLINSTQNSLVVGFNTTTPTLFVGGSNHRVGIGTSNPTAKLEITGGDLKMNGGDVLLNGNYLSNDGDANDGIWIDTDGNVWIWGGDNLYMNGGGNVALYGGWLSGDGDNEGLSVDVSGKVGIGTTNPTEELHVVGDIYCTGKLTSEGGNDPPYVLYNKETRQAIAERIAEEVPEDKRDGAVLFWNGDELRFEVYLPQKGEFRDLQGNLVGELSEPIVEL